MCFPPAAIYTIFLAVSEEKLEAKKSSKRRETQSKEKLEAIRSW
jgi:hypothetical protein